MRISDWSSDVCSSDLVAVWHSPSGTPPGDGSALGGPQEGRPLAAAVEHEVGAGGVGGERAGQEDHGAGDVVGRAEPGGGHGGEIGRASCRERVCQYVSISVVAVSLKNKNTTRQPTQTPTT